MKNSKTVVDFKINELFKNNVFKSVNEIESSSMLELIAKYFRSDNPNPEGTREQLDYILSTKDGRERFIRAFDFLEPELKSTYLEIITSKDFGSNLMTKVLFYLSEEQRSKRIHKDFDRSMEGMINQLLKSKQFQSADKNGSLTALFNILLSPEGKEKEEKLSSFSNGKNPDLLKESIKKLSPKNVGLLEEINGISPELKKMHLVNFIKSRRLTTAVKLISHCSPNPVKNATLTYLTSNEKNRSRLK